MRVAREHAVVRVQQRKKKQAKEREARRAVASDIGANAFECEREYLRSLASDSVMSQEREHSAVSSKQ